eukprot:792268-Prymnesium_polylepis.1
MSVPHREETAPVAVPRGQVHCVLHLPRPDGVATSCAPSPRPNPGAQGATFPRARSPTARPGLRNVPRAASGRDAQHNARSADPPSSLSRAQSSSAPSARCGRTPSASRSGSSRAAAGSRRRAYRAPTRRRRA